MDRRIFYRDELLFESDLMLMERYAYEALGFFAMDILGPSTVVAGFPCTGTLVPSLSFLLGPGRLYSLQVPDATAMGQTLGLGGLAADTNPDHSFLKAAQYRDTHTLGPLVAPGTGLSQVFLVEAQFTEVDDAPTTTQFYNTDAPDTPITSPIVPARRDIAAVQIKNGIAATTGTQVAPVADAGWTPLYAITLVHGQTTIGAGDIAVALGAPFAPKIGNAVPVQEPTIQANPVAGTVTLDFALGNYFKVLMNGTISTVTFANLPPSGIAQQITVDFIGDGTTRTVTGLGVSSIKWMGATAPAAQPTFVFTAGYENTVVFVARDGVARQKASFSGISAA